MLFLRFGLGREDVFPIEDLGIRKGMWTLNGEDLNRSDMQETAEQWSVPIIREAFRLEGYDD